MAIRWVSLLNGLTRARTAFEVRKHPLKQFYPTRTYYRAEIGSDICGHGVFAVPVRAARLTTLIWLNDWQGGA
jgi:hypothetical protein